MWQARDGIPVITAAHRLAAYQAALTAGRRQKTVAVYMSAARRFEGFLSANGWAPGACPVSALDAFVAVHVKKMAAASITTVTTGIRQYVKWLRERGVALPDFAKPVLPRIQIKIPTVLDHEALSRYAMAVRSLPEPSQTAALLLPACGLRASEIGGLTAKDIDAQSGQIYFLIRDGKSAKDRPVPLLPEGHEPLRSYLTHVRPQLGRGRFVFPSSSGGPLCVRTFEKHMHRIGLALGLELTPHCLRHTYITHLSESGVDALIIREIVGHKNIATTQRYCHPSRAKLAQNLVRVDGGWMAGQKPPPADDEGGE